MADEIPERRRTLGSRTYPAWDERAGKRARMAWRSREGDPLRDVRAYRNRLVQGRVIPQWNVRVFEVGTGAFHGERLMYPRLDRVEDHLDWRRAFDPAKTPSWSSLRTPTSSSDGHGSGRWTTRTRPGGSTFSHSVRNRALSGTP